MVLERTPSNCPLSARAQAQVMLEYSRARIYSVWLSLDLGLRVTEVRTTTSYGLRILTVQTLCPQMWSPRYIPPLYVPAAGFGLGVAN